MSNRISIKEFKDLGYLQEVNRQFLHPLGLALEIIFDPDTDEIKLGGIWDCRDEKSGIIFQIVDPKKALHILKIQRKARQNRIEELGYYIQPIGMVSE